MTIDRRRLLQALGSASALALTPHALPAFAQTGDALGAAAFGTLSAALTGYPRPDPVTAAKMLRAFATPARRTALAALARMVADTRPAALDAALRAGQLDSLANELVAAWFSGVVTTGKGKQVVLYADAYVWTAMTYSKPMGVCGGPMGYWSTPPQ